MNEKRAAAYQGEGWQARSAAHRAERSQNRIWCDAAVTQESDPLKRVVLFAPRVDTPPTPDVNAVQHIGRINFEKLHAEIKALGVLYESLGVQVEWIQPVEPGWFYNLFFARDLFVMTPAGAIVARMGSRVRAGEEKHIANTLAGLGVPIMRTIVGMGTFEGADALWLREDRVLIGVGNRTNQAGYEQVAGCLREQGVRVQSIPLPNTIQHLLGLVQIVDRDLAVVRAEIAPPVLGDILSREGFQMIELAETEEVSHRQALNFVTITPRCVVMVGGNPKTRALLETAGLNVAAEIAVPELLKGAGGIACATGILDRRRD